MKPTTLSICTLLLLFLFSCSSPEKVSHSSDQKIYSELSDALNKGILDVWYPRTIDSIYGGFLSDFDYKWDMKGPQNKMIVTQSRHVWTCSSVAGFYPAKKDYFLKMASHGVRFLKDKMWDQKHGGFFNLVGQLIEVSKWE